MSKFLLMWWFAIVSGSGELLLLNTYHTKSDCEIVRGGYVRLHLNHKITVCMPYE